MIATWRLRDRLRREVNSHEKRTKTEDSAQLFNSLPHELEAILHLTNEVGVNTISLNFNYPNYPNEGFVSCELESEITCSNETFCFLIDFFEIIFINENETLLKGTLAVNLFNSDDVDCFQFELLIQQENCQEIIKNSTICVAKYGDTYCEY